MLTTACRSLFLFLLSSLYPLWSLFCSAVNYLLKIFHLCLGSKLVAAGYLAINKFQFILIVCLHCSLVRNCFCHWLLVSLHTVIWLFYIRLYSCIRCIFITNEIAPCRFLTDAAVPSKDLISSIKILYSKTKVVACFKKARSSYWLVMFINHYPCAPRFCLCSPVLLIFQ